jgi:hypothetical protein
MTTYAYDPALRHLIACCGTGGGARAHTVARLRRGTAERLGLRLAQQLTRLSAEAWLSYTDAEQAGPVPDVAALAALGAPHFAEGGWAGAGRTGVVEHAHEVGRLLAEIGGAGVRRAVAADVAEEFASVGRALRGELAGRSRQAVELTGLDAPPTQVAHADRLLDEAPSGAEALLVDVEPTAACVAAAHWLVAAVDVTSRAIGGGGVREVLRPEEAAEPFDTVAPTVVVDLVGEGGSPLSAVQRLVRPAVRAARGFVPAAEDCVLPGLIVLDPGRPARHLLDLLLLALRTCERVYVDHVAGGAPLGHPDPVGAAGRGFDEEVRIEAARTADRLLAADVAVSR